MAKQYQLVTDRIIAMLETGVRPWSQPWAASGGGRPLRFDGKPYRGMNVLNLWAAGMSRGFVSRHWMTYKKASELGAQVRKGAKSEYAFYVGAINRTEQNKAGEEIDRTIPFLKAYNVFNTDEIDGLPAQYGVVAPLVVLDDAARIAACDRWIAGTGANIVHGGGRAFYQPSADLIRLPEFSSFDSACRYYSTAFHELAHWSGAEKRLDRLKGKIFGSPEYAFEELVAELSASYLCADLAVNGEPREDHAAYLASWLKALRDDSRNIFRAASYAEKACTYLHDLQQAGEQAIAA
jgi:antirestriction protein ArdC